MIHEKFCTREVSLLAKKKGFNWICHHYFRLNDKDLFMVFPSENWGDTSEKINAPTQGLLQQWLREEKKIIVEVFVDDDSDTPLTYNIHQYKNGNWKCVCHHHGNYYSVNDWELCLEDALKYALKKLI